MGGVHSLLVVVRLLLPVLGQPALLVVDERAQDLHALDVQLHLVRVVALALAHLARRDAANTGQL